MADRLEPRKANRTRALRVPGWILNREELAWAAGFYDGEGSVGNYASRGYKGRIVLAVAQTEKGPLYRFRNALGFGKIYGPSKKRSDRHKPSWVYQAGSFEKVQAVIAMLWPFLCDTKRQQARRALESYFPKEYKWKSCKRAGHRVILRNMEHRCLDCRKEEARRHRLKKKEWAAQRLLCN